MKFSLDSIADGSNDKAKLAEQEIQVKKHNASQKVQKEHFKE